MMEAASHISGDVMVLETAWMDRMKWIVLVCLKILQSFLSRLPKSDCLFRLKGKSSAIILLFPASRVSCRLF